MITDFNLVLDDTAVAKTSTGVSANHIAVANLTPDFTAGEPLVFTTNVTTAMTGAGTAFEFRVVASASSSSVTTTWTQGSDVTSSAVDSKTVFTRTNHGLHTGHLVTVAAPAGTLPTGISAGTYVVIRLTADTFKLATTMPLAFAGTSVGSTAGTGGFTLAPQAMTLVSSGAVNQLHLPAGASVSLIVPPGLAYGAYQIPALPYLLMQYVATGSPGAVIWTSRVVKNVHGLKYHASGFTLS